MEITILPRSCDIKKVYFCEGITLRFAASEYITDEDELTVNISSNDGYSKVYTITKCCFDEKYEYKNRCLFHLEKTKVDDIKIKLSHKGSSSSIVLMSTSLIKPTYEYIIDVSDENSSIPYWFMED